MDANQFAELLSHHLSGETMDDGELKSEMLLCAPHIKEPNTFIVWNGDGDDNEMFVITVTKAEG